VKPPLFSEEILGKMDSMKIDRLDSAITYANRVAIRNGHKLEKDGERWVVKSPKLPENQMDFLNQIIGTKVFRVNERPIVGIYFLCEKRTIVYVGQSINIFSRISSHRSEGEKRFDSVMAIRCKKENLSAMESALIAILKPRYNWIESIGEFCVPDKRAFLNPHETIKFLEAY
jgi:hypothetical protein